MSKDGITIKLNGANEILDMRIDDKLLQDKDRLIKIIKNTFKEAMRDMQKRMAKKMMGSNINFDALKKLGL